MNTMDFYKQINDFNLVTYYLLPLIYLNKFSFGPNNFINSYVTRDGCMLVVKVKDLDKVFPITWLSDYMIKEGEGGILYFELPEEWREEFKRFVFGRYSWFSDEAIDQIRQYSGLNWKVKMQKDGEEGYFSDVRLKALTRDDDLRSHLENLFDANLPEDAEFIPPPKETEFYGEPA